MKKPMISFGKISIILLSLISAITWAIFYSMHLTIVYNDAMSHLNIARLVVDNLQPGFSQLGSVWLPLSHLLYIPLIWNDWAWHSGFAGSIVSMISYVAAAAGVYLISYELTKKRIASIVATSAFAFNLNVLYLQSTPLTETLYLALFVFASLFLIRYLIHRSTESLILAAIFSALQIITRYDGWFTALISGIALIVFELWVNRRKLGQALGPVILFSFPVAFTAALWLIWNKLIFNNAFYFITGPYSAHAQQQNIEGHSGLLTKHNMLMSLKAFNLDMIANVGLAILALGLIGWVVYLFRNRLQNAKIRLLIISLLSSVVVFNIIALYLGFSIINLPELGWKPSDDPASTLFNARYGIVALPAAAIGIAFLARKKLLAGLLGIVIITQAVIISQTGIITIQDGTNGSSAFVNHDIAQELKEITASSNEGEIAISTSFFNAVMFESKLPLKRFIHEGVSDEWQDMLKNPDLHTKWIVMANGDVGDPIYTNLVEKQHSAFLRNYSLVFKGKHANIYELKQTSQLFVTVDNKKFMIGHQEFRPVGVNSYDIAYRTPAEIDQNFNQLKQAGVTTLRFWAFGDAHPEGFQKTPGVINEDKLKTLDLIITKAEAYDIRIIPVFVNYWEDYGGVQQYLKWTGQNPTHIDDFYSSSATRELYKNYVNHILTRKNTITGRKYTDEPAILSWELANEPRAASQWKLSNWAKVMAEYVKEIDGNHLVSIGLDHDTINKNEGEICSIKAISFCSIHLYIEDKGITFFDDETQLDDWLATNRKDFDSKPLLISELGISKSTRPFNKAPLDMLGHIIDEAQTDEYQGWLIWNWALKPDDSFGFSPNSGNNPYDRDALEGLLKANR